MTMFTPVKVMLSRPTKISVTRAGSASVGANQAYAYYITKYTGAKLD